jgi:hypothetical protein
MRRLATPGSKVRATLLICGAAMLTAVTGDCTYGAEKKSALSASDYAAVLEDLNDEAAFQRFLDKVPTITVGTEIKRTYYVIEGDLRLTRDEVRGHLRGFLLREQPQTAMQAALPKGQATGELYVNTKNGVPTKWLVGQRALSYAIDRASFTSEQHALLAINMPIAIADWVDACDCGLSITHKPEFDDKPELGKVTFVVTHAPNEPRYFAVAFFPGDAADQRYLHIMDPYFNPGGYDQVGILRHEIGHILGYRHAHISGVAGCAQEPKSPNWVALSPYDSSSAMHYPCGGGGSLDFQLSERDKADHRAFYAK